MVHGEKKRDLSVTLNCSSATLDNFQNGSYAPSRIDSEFIRPSIYSYILLILAVLNLKINSSGPRRFIFMFVKISLLVRISKFVTCKLKKSMAREKFILSICYRIGYDVCRKTCP